MNNNEFGARLAKETLTGDIAAFLIDRLRAFPKPYQQMSEKEQGEMFNACNSEYQDADGEGVPDPVAAEVPALEDHSVVDAEFEEVEDSFRDDNDAA